MSNEVDDETPAFSLTNEQRQADAINQNNLINKLVSLPRNERVEITCLFERSELQFEGPIFTIMGLALAQNGSVGSLQVSTPILNTYGQRFYNSSKKAINSFHSVRNKILKKHPNIKIVWEGISNNEKLS